MGNVCFWFGLSLIKDVEEKLARRFPGKCLALNVFTILSCYET